MSRSEEFVGVRVIDAVDAYGEGQHRYCMWLREDEPIVRCRDCKFAYHDECPKYDKQQPDGFCAWGERNERS